MSAEADFRACLIAHAPLTALVGTRVVLNGVEEGTPTPYVVYTSAHNEQRGLGGAVLADEVTFQVECWAATAVQADAVANAVVAALATAPPMAGATMLERATGFDAENGLDATVLTISWWL